MIECYRTVKICCCKCVTSSSGSDGDDNGCWWVSCAVEHSQVIGQSDIVDETNAYSCSQTSGICSVVSTDTGIKKNSLLCGVWFVVCVSQCAGHLISDSRTSHTVELDSCGRLSFWAMGPQCSTNYVWKYPCSRSSYSPTRICIQRCLSVENLISL